MSANQSSAYKDGQPPALSLASGSGFLTRITRLTIVPDGESILSERATSIAIDDEGAGEFVKVSQGGENAEVRIDPAEWPHVRSAINRLIPPNQLRGL